MYAKLVVVEEATSSKPATATDFRLLAGVMGVPQMPPTRLGEVKCRIKDGDVEGTYEVPER
jgi:hypothetical protein